MSRTVPRIPSFPRGRAPGVLLGNGRTRHRVRAVIVPVHNPCIRGEPNVQDRPDRGNPSIGPQTRLPPYRLAAQACLSRKRLIRHPRKWLSTVSRPLYQLTSLRFKTNATNKSVTRRAAETVGHRQRDRRTSTHAPDPREHPDQEGRRTRVVRVDRHRGADPHSCRHRHWRRELLDHGRRTQTARHPAGAARGRRGHAVAQREEDDRAVGQEPLQPADAGRRRLPDRHATRQLSRDLQPATEDAEAPDRDGPLLDGPTGHPLLPQWSAPRRRRQAGHCGCNGRSSARVLRGRGRWSGRGRRDVRTAGSMAFASARK